MAQNDEEVLRRITEIKTEVASVKTTLNTHAKADNTVTNAELSEQTKKVLEAIKKGPDKENKSAWESFFEALGLKDLVAAVKEPQWQNALYLAIAAVGTLLLGKLLDLGKLFNFGLEKLWKAVALRRDPNSTSQGRILTLNERGIPSFRPRAEVETPPLVSVANADTASLDALNRALQGLRPEVTEFNTAVRALPSARQISKSAAAIEKLKRALTGLPSVTPIRNLTAAVNRLNNASDRYRPNALPNAAAMNSTASAAGNLTRATDGLREGFRQLADAARGVASAVGTN